jgi:gliding motility-associated-like protein
MLSKVFMPLLLLCIISARNCLCQNQSKWFFGSHAGLDFATSPPTAITGSLIDLTSVSTGFCDGSGNLLFYTDGNYVYNRQHGVMANGSGLYASGSFYDCFAIKKPGSSSQYYIFTARTNIFGIYYSVVDMSLAAGLGSVTVKNAPLLIYAPPSYTLEPSDRKISGTRHCNGIDEWIVFPASTSYPYLIEAYLVTSAGVSLTPVTSTVSTPYFVSDGLIKFSPNGKKLILSHNWLTNSGFTLFDFDNSTGIVSNPVVLTNSVGPGAEFSPDGSKVYIGNHVQFSYTHINQWDLCAGSASAVIASKTTFTAPSTASNIFFLQLAPDGKIYFVDNVNGPVGVINNPNAAGPACGISYNAQSLLPNTGTAHGFPNLNNYLFKKVPTSPPITHSVNTTMGCKTASFNAPPPPVVYCPVAGYAVAGYNWDFGEPASGAANTSTLMNPYHTYASTGNYLTKLILQYSCGGGTDTLWHPVPITEPTVSILNTPATCSTLGAATINISGGIGPFHSTWVPGSLTGQIVSGLNPGSYTASVLDSAAGCTSTVSNIISTNYNLNGVVVLAHPLCYGFSTGSASMQINGGTGNYTYTWSPNSSSLSMVSGLLAGTYTVIAADQISPCTVTQTFQITNPPILSASITVSSASACVGNSISLTGNGSGGTPPYSFLWSNGSNGVSTLIGSNISGTYQSTLYVTDANGCANSSTVQLTFSTGPILNVSTTTICAGSEATLIVTGASSYTWMPGNETGPTFTASPQSTKVYTVTASLAGCIMNNAITTTITVVPDPSLTISLSSNTLCFQSFNGSSNSITLTASGANTYSILTSNYLVGSFGGNASVVLSPNPPFGNTVTIVTTTIYGSNGFCTVSSPLNFTIIPNPTIGLNSYSPVICAGQTFTYKSNGAGNYMWNTGTPGLNSYTSPVTVCSASTRCTYSVIGESLGCFSPIQTTTINVYPLPIFSITPSNPTTCLNDPILLKATGNADIYHWLPANSLSSSSGPSVMASPASNQTYTVVATAQGCTDSTMVTVMILPLPIPNAFLSKSTICRLDTVEFSAAGGKDYHWFGPMDYTFSGKDVKVSINSTSYQGSYTVVVTDEKGCKNTADVFLNVLELPTGNLIGRNTGCEPFCANYVLNNTGTSSIFTDWQISGHKLEKWNFNYCFGTSGNFVIDGTIKDTATMCSSKLRYDIQVYPKPETDFTFDPPAPIQGLDEVVFKSVPDEASSCDNSWYFTDQYKETNKVEISRTFVNDGDYLVSMVSINTWGCSDTTIKKIVVEPDFTIYVPNAFTPNQDFQNDIFLPVIRGVNKYELIIFNRWGTKLFTTSDLFTGWDGKYADQPCKQDFYIWKIILTSYAGKNKTSVGEVLLTR